MNSLTKLCLYNLAAYCYLKKKKKKQGKGMTVGINNQWVIFCKMFSIALIGGVLLLFKPSVTLFGFSRCKIIMRVYV